MGLVDVLIPGLIGLVCVVSPGSMTRAEGEEGEATRSKIRMCGFVLLAVAGIYAFLAAAGPR